MDPVQAALEAIRATDDAVDDHCAVDDQQATATRSFGALRDWQAFSDRVAQGKATPSCVIDFPYADSGKNGLNLKGDDRLLERMICFHDRLIAPPDKWLVVVHIHTVLRWGDRGTVAAQRLHEVTSVNARHAEKAPDGTFAQEQRKFYVVPKSKKLAQDWQELYKNGAKQQIVWKPHTANSIPTHDADAKWVYDALRVVIQKGDALCHEAVVTHGIQQTQKTMRGGTAGEQGEVEYEVVGLAPPAEASIKPAILPSPDEPPGTSTVDARGDEMSSDRGKTCQVCGRRLDQCVCPAASSKVNAIHNANANASSNATFNATFNASANPSQNASHNASANASFHASQNASHNASANASFHASQNASFNASANANAGANVWREEPNWNSLPPPP